MGWKKVRVTDADFPKTEQKLRNTLDAVYVHLAAQSGGRRGRLRYAGMFHRRPDPGVSEFYFTPDAVDVIDPDLAKHAATPCDPPPREGSHLLYGTERWCWSQLGRPKGS
ncbi:MAG: hypothetical protein EXQ93_00855 [Alphaproteobacteria bacterium]|nr:hypothetical protein [Alphaproteobacteria bacterium]